MPVTFGDHVFLEERAIRQIHIGKKSSIFVVGVLRRVLFESYALASEKHLRFIRCLLAEALHGFPRIDRLRSVESDQSHSDAFPVDHDCDRIAVDHFYDRVERPRWSSILF